MDPSRGRQTTNPRHQEQRRLLINGRDPRALSDNTTVRRAQGGRANKCNTFNKPVHACARVAPGTLLIITSKSCPPSRISSCPEAVIFVMSSTIFQLSGNVPKRNRKHIVKLRTWVEQSHAAFGKDTKKRTRLQNRYVLSFASDYESPFCTGSVHIRSDILEKQARQMGRYPGRRTELRPLLL